MAKYKLIIKKEDIEIFLETNDKDFIERELGSWIVLASASSETTRVAPQIEEMESETKEIIRNAIHNPEESIEKTEEKSIPLAKEETIASTEKVEVIDDFSKVLQEKVEKVEKPQETKSSGNTIDKFADIVSSKKIKTAFDCLIACAYHLVERENFERFTLKQINTLSKALIEEPVEHDTVKDALDKKLIKIVPDYTGISDTMEYTLTNLGMGYFKDELE